MGRRGLAPLDRSIASITKVMTALVFLEQDPDLTRDVVISRRDVRRAGYKGAELSWVLEVGSGQQWMPGMSAWSLLTGSS